MKWERTRGKKAGNISTLLIRRDAGPGTLWVKKRGRGTYANDRPPVLGTVGRVSGQVRLRVVTDTKQATLRAHVEQFTGLGTHVYTDEYESYATIERPHTTVCMRRGNGHAMQMEMVLKVKYFCRRIASRENLTFWIALPHF